MGMGVEKLLKETDVADREEQRQTEAKVGGLASGAVPLYVFYGRNTGTSEAFAGRVASDAAAHSRYFIHSKRLFMKKNDTYDRDRLQSIPPGSDVVTTHLPTDGPIIIVTAASYEGEPADNAAQFGWLQGLSPDTQQLKGVRYAVGAHAPVRARVGRHAARVEWGGKTGAKGRGGRGRGWVLPGL